MYGHASIWSEQVPQRHFLRIVYVYTSIGCLFSGDESRILGAMFDKGVLLRYRGISTIKVSCCSLGSHKRTVFLFVKQYIEDKMSAECCCDLTFRAHFLNSRKRSVR